MTSSADVLALYTIVGRLADAVRQSGVPVPDVTAEFLQRRKMMLQKQLESVEKSNPGLAARLLEVIDTIDTVYPRSDE